ncbi:MAG: hypothetical protein GC201_16215 [Alphaproteobacteria bacterium]|nr:hypothetical protein [Alphaproteobacteria bacterium]
MLHHEHPARPTLLRRIVNRLRGPGDATGKNAERLELLARMPRGAVCAEIGVWKGAYSRHILRLADPATLYLVDPWAFRGEFPGRLYGGGAAQGQKDMDAIHRDVRRAFAGDQRVSVRRETADAFFRALPDAALDWVYIDGDHGLEGVTADLEGAFRTVKPGGAIAGDDYEWTDEAGVASVKQATDAFCSRHGLALELLGDQFLIRRAACR